MPSIRKLMKLLVIASFQINFFDLACCFFRNKIYSDIEIWSPLLKRRSNFSNLESYFLLAVFVFKSKVSIQVIWKMIQWRFCAANQQVLILKFASRSWKFPGFLRNRPLRSIIPVKKQPAIYWINFHPVRVCHNIEVLVTVFTTILH